LDAAEPGALRQVGEQDEVECERRREDRVATEEVDLDLHRIPEPAEDVDVVPTFFVVSARRVVVDAHLVEDVAVQLGILLGLQDVFQHAELRLFLRLEVLRIVEHFTVAVAENVGGIPTRQAEHARLQHRRDHGLHHGLAGLEVFAADGDAALGREVAQHRRVDGEVRRAVGERNAFEDRGVCVEHRRRDGRVVGVDRFLERLKVLVCRARLDELLGRCAPDHHDAVDLLVVAETVDVFANRIQHRPLVDGAECVVGADVLHVFAVERRLHRADAAQRVGDRLDVARALEHAGALRGNVRVIRERIPRAPLDVFQLGEWYKVLDQRRAVVGALTETDGAHLRERTNRRSHAALGELDSGDERARHRTEADGEHTEFAGGRRD